MSIQSILWQNFNCYIHRCLRIDPSGSRFYRSDFGDAIYRRTACPHSHRTNSLEAIRSHFDQKNLKAFSLCIGPAWILRHMFDSAILVKRTVPSFPSTGVVVTINGVSSSKSLRDSVLEQTNTQQRVSCLSARDILRNHTLLESRPLTSSVVRGTSHKLVSQH